MDQKGKLDPACIADQIKSHLDKDIIKEMIRDSFEDKKTKIGQDALTAVVEILNCLCTESCLRAIKQALRDNKNKVELEHLEKCLPQLVLNRTNVAEKIQMTTGMIQIKEHYIQK